MGKDEPTKHDSELLLDELEKQRSFNKIILIIAIAMLILLYLIGICFIFTYRDNPRIMVIVFGGIFAALLGVVKRLHSIWREKFIIDHASLVLRNFSPEQAARFILSLHRSFVTKSSSVRE